MELRRSSVELLKSPYEATHISIYQYLQGADSKGTTVVPFQHLFRHGLQPSTGPRGIRQISNSRPFAAKQERYEDQPLRMMTRHRRGQLLIWDCDTRALIGSCPHGLNTTVCDFVPTSTHIFTRVECDAGKPNTGEDRCIFVWDTKTFALTDRLHGHNERVTSLAVEPSNPELLVSCSLDKDILIWDLSQRARVPKQRLDTSVIGMVLDMEIVDGHIVASGTVNSLGVWSLSTGNLESTTPPTVKESGCATMRPHPLTAERRKSLKSSSQQLTIFTGTVDGYVMEWGWDPVGKGPSNGSTTGDNIKQVWQSKSHTATVSLLIADEEVLFSGSTFDGGSLYHRLVGSRTHVGAEGEGCRSAVLDTYNKLLLMGSESGTIAAYNYAEFAVGNARNVTAVWEFRPHSSATSGLFLEVSHGNIWERFLSCSADGSVCIVDYRTERSMNTLSMDLMGPVSPFPGSLPVPRRKSLGPEVSISLISQSEAEPTKNVGPITCISYVESRCVLVVGTRDGRIRSYLCKTLKGGRIEWKQDREWTFAPNIPIHLSHPIGDDAAVFSVCFASDKAAGKNRTGGVALLVLDQPTIYTKITSPDLFPKRSTVHALNRFPAPWLGTKSPSARFALSLISRGGAVQIFTVHYGPPPVTVAKGEPKTPASPSTAPAWYIGECIMTIRPPTLGPLPTSTKPENLFSYRYQAEPSGAKPPGLVMTHSDAKAIHYSRLSALATKDDQRETFPSLDLKDASLPTTGVQQVILVCQSDVLAIARFADCPQAFVFAMDGTLSHIVEYNGSVTATDLSATLRKRKSLCLSLQSFLTTKRPANPCTFLAYSEECRAVLLVYGDGLLQLMDTSNKYIFSRHWMPDTPSSVRLTNKFIFAAAGLELCTFTIHPRIIVNEMADETAKPAKRS